MVAEIKAWRAWNGEVFESEREARQYELKSAVVSAMVDARIDRGSALTAAEVIINDNFEEIYELVMSYKKTLPAVATPGPKRLNANPEAEVGG